MTTTQLLDRVHAEARELRPLRVVLSIIAAIPFAIAWVLGVACRVLWIAFSWAWAAAVVGFKTGRAKPDGT